jgi:hypothetical protein
MNPIPIRPCTRRMTSPTGMEDECGTLEISDVKDPIWGNMMQSAWMPNDEERSAIASGAPIILSIVGTGHPVVSVFVGEMTNGR